MTTVALEALYNVNALAKSTTLEPSLRLYCIRLYTDAIISGLDAPSPTQGDPKPIEAGDWVIVSYPGSSVHGRKGLVVEVDEDDNTFLVQMGTHEALSMWFYEHQVERYEGVLK